MPTPPIAGQATTGPSDKVPCPWCAKPNNFEHGDGDLFHNMDLSQGKGDPGGGPVFECDYCNKPMRVVAVRSVRFISVRQAK